MTEGFHHYHHHKREAGGKRCAHREKWKNTIDQFVYFIAVIGIIATLPQVYIVWFANDVAGVSFVSWAWYSVSASFWVLYGVAHKEKPIIYTNIGWVLVELLVVIGLLVR